MSRFKGILGFGSALWDILAHVPEEVVAASGRDKGGMTLVEPGEQAGLLMELARRGITLEEAPGGSACNTVAGLARLGAKAFFAGRRGSDAVGERLEADLQEQGLRTCLARDPAETGCVLSLVTPDAQRTMYTSLAAASRFAPSDLDGLPLDEIGLFYVEGYLLFNAPVFDAVLELSRKHGIPVALDCGAFSVVECFRDKLHEILSQGAIEILLANEDEAKALTGAADGLALEWIANHVPVAVVKLGARGALLAQGGRRVVVPATKVPAVVDTTGAGDLWAAGFLHGLDMGLDLHLAGQWAARVAAEVIQVTGARIPQERWDVLKESV